MVRTIDGDGHALRENIAVGANKGRDLVEGVGLQEFLGRVGGIGVDLLELEAVGLCDGADGRRAGVALSRNMSATTRI
jgi:hypothetical protein